MAWGYKHYHPYQYGAATSSWYEEIDHYNWDDPGFSYGTGHFTQIVWKNTEKVGFGIAQRYDAPWLRTWVVANYDPPGNFVRRRNGKVIDGYEQNVLPLI